MAAPLLDWPDDLLPHETGPDLHEMVWYLLER